MLIYANLFKYHRQTERQANTSKVLFGTSQKKYFFEYGLGINLDIFSYF